MRYSCQKESTLGFIVLGRGRIYMICHIIINLRGRKMRYSYQKESTLGFRVYSGHLLRPRGVNEKQIMFDWLITFARWGHFSNGKKRWKADGESFSTLFFRLKNQSIRLVHNFRALKSFFKREKAMESWRWELFNAFFRLKNDLNAQKLWINRVECSTNIVS